MKRAPSLGVSVDLDIDCVMQEGQAMVLLMDVSSTIYEVAESLQVFHLDSMMRGRHIVHDLHLSSRYTQVNVGKRFSELRYY